MKLDIKSLAILAIVVAAIVLVVTFGLKDGNKIPAGLTLTKSDGATLNLDSLQGKPYLLEFW